MGASQVADRRRRRQARGDARARSRDPVRALHAPETRALEEEFAAFVGAKYALAHPLRDERAPARARGGRTSARATRSSSPRTASSRRRSAWRCRARRRSSSTSTPRRGTSIRRSRAAAITPRTKAIMPVHIHGEAADLGGAARALQAKRSSRSSRTPRRRTAPSTKGRRVGALGVVGRLLAAVEQEPHGGRGRALRHERRGSARERANQVRNFGRTCSSRRDDWDPSVRSTGIARLESHGVGSMYRGNEMAAAFCRAQLARLPELTSGVTEERKRVSRTSWASSPASSRRARCRAARRCTTSTASASTRRRRASNVAAARAPRRHQGGARRRGARGRLLARPRAPGAARLPEACTTTSTFRALARRDRPREELRADAATAYDARCSTSSIVLFSQTCPLIAQSEATVDRYAEAFARVWHHREAIVEAF